MDDVQQRLEKIREQQTNLVRARASAEAQLEGVQSRRAEVLSRLSDQGLTPEMAQARVAELGTEVESILRKIQESISDY